MGDGQRQQPAPGRPPPLIAGRRGALLGTDSPQVNARSGIPSDLRLQRWAEPSTDTHLPPPTGVC
ncbi:hypothetical protein FRAHR75_910007 [Frankia sp. Hr75.2]|nr:hypothetical protein FRAHR75_910007 [Frankia sp. Hr75.2]